MHCPQCGQQQSSSEMRFCSRCGFPMGAVAELLANGGVPRAAVDESQQQAMSPRRKGVSQGVLMLMIGAVFVPILAVLSDYRHSEALELLAALAAVLFFIGGFVRILYAVLFEQSAPGAKKDLPEYVPPVAPAQINAGPRVHALPPRQNVPDFAPRRSNTAELSRPPSVTENTTKLLDEEKAARDE